MASAVKGLAAVRRALRDLEAKTNKGVTKAVQTAVVEGHGGAVDLAPVNMGKLRQSIFFEVKQAKGRWGVVEGIIGANELYAPFVEFGTGAKVQVPGEFQELASKFKGKGGGNFDEMLESIIDWVKAKGITGVYSIKTQRRASRRGVDEGAEDRRVAFLIAMSILKKGIRPQPFLYPGYLKAKVVLIREIEQLVKTVK